MTQLTSQTIDGLPPEVRPLTGTPIVDELPDPQKSGDSPSGKSKEQLADEAEDAHLDRLLGGDATAPAEEIVETQEPIPADNQPADQDSLVRALRRDNVPQTVIDAALKDPEAFKTWAGAALQRQREVDGYSKRLQEAEEKASGTVDQPDPKTEDEPASSEPTEDGSEVGNNSLDALTDEIGEEAVGYIRSLEARLLASEAKVTALVEHNDGADRRVAEAETMRALDAAKPIVFGAYENVTADQEISITNRMQELGRTKPGTFNSVEQMMRTAATDVLGPPPVRAEKRQATVQRQASRRTKAVTTQMTTEQRESRAADVILAGGTKEQARAAFEGR